MLRNLFTGHEKPFGEPNESLLDLLETGATAFRLAELSIRPVSGRFDYAHMKAIHRHLFQDVYEWAGRERTAPTQGPMTKAGHRYYPPGRGSRPPPMRNSPGWSGGIICVGSHEIGLSRSLRKYGES
ncbi:Fic family protein [Mycetocola sp. BIGb0189]|uniref:Fic family protein n=1 Tax=Mycetocola sp. BIGb0189 TaxID=2940604 RepID=UPI0021685030|nr:Fic family protein [Mycetocola sp. BIGb0189]